jgi:hypothetical protein
MATRDDERDDARDQATPSEGTRAQQRGAGYPKDERPQPPMGGYQEGSVESVGGGPSGTDADDRTAERGTRPQVPRAADHDGNPDAFVSSEVVEESADAPGRPERTRG